MIPIEVANLATQHPESKPPGFGRTILARVPADVDEQVVLERIRRAWDTIARWGRWSDEDLGEWPSTDEGLDQLPEWLQEALKQEPSFEAENWMDDLHDREWIWWSGITLDHLLKIDLLADGLPISTWPLEFVIQQAGGMVFYKGDWLSSNKAVSRPDESL